PPFTERRPALGEAFAQPRVPRIDERVRRTPAQEIAMAGQLAEQPYVHESTVSTERGLGTEPQSGLTPELPPVIRRKGIARSGGCLDGDHGFVVFRLDSQHGLEIDVGCGWRTRDRVVNQPEPRPRPDELPDAIGR